MPVIAYFTLSVAITLITACVPQDYRETGQYRYSSGDRVGNDRRHNSEYTESQDNYTQRESNPTVELDYKSTEQYDADGTYHSEDVEEDRRASFYSPGRNEAITKPETVVESWSEDPGVETTVEQTSWIGADNRPHSTTVESTTTTDEDGNSHTDTNVTLKSKRRDNKPITAE